MRPMTSTTSGASYSYAICSFSLITIPHLLRARQSSSRRRSKEKLAFLTNDLLPI
jgi:hypothetical protein